MHGAATSSGQCSVGGPLIVAVVVEAFLLNLDIEGLIDR